MTAVVICIVPFEFIDILYGPKQCTIFAWKNRNNAAMPIAYYNNYCKCLSPVIIIGMDKACRKFIAFLLRFQMKFQRNGSLLAFPIVLSLYRIVSEHIMANIQIVKRKLVGLN